MTTCKLYAGPYLDSGWEGASSGAFRLLMMKTSHWSTWQEIAKVREKTKRLLINSVQQMGRCIIE